MKLDSNKFEDKYNYIAKSQKIMKLDNKEGEDK